MSFINWGSQTPEELRSRREAEEAALFEQAVNRAMRARTSAGGGVGILLASIDWLDVSPEGTGSEGHDYSNFDEWITASFSPVEGARRLIIQSGTANAHVHSQLSSSNLSISLYNDDTDSWQTVWQYTLMNPNNPEDDSRDYFMNGINVTFDTIPAITKIKVSSSPGSDQSYHDWDINSTLFKFYK
jgi:hypothetical protein